MLRRILIGVVLTAFLVAGIAAAGDPAPSIVIPKMRHDFGDIFEQEKYEYQFLVRNAGKADLVINDVKPG